MKRYWITSLILISSIAFINTRNMFLIFSFALILSIIVDYSALRPLLRWKFLFFLAILMFGIPLLIGSRESNFYGISYSHDILLMSLNMGFRSIIILTAIKILTNHISIEQMKDWLKRLRLKHFSEVFATAMQLMPQVKEIALQTFNDFRQAPKQMNIFSHLFNWTAKLIARLLLFAEESEFESRS